MVHSRKKNALRNYVADAARRRRRILRRRILFYAAAFGIALHTPYVCPAASRENKVWEKTDFAMDTVVSEKIYTTGEDLTEEVVEILKKVETDWISWTNEKSQVYQINENSGSSVEVSDETAGYLKDILKLSEDSGGALDPTIGKIIRLWDIDGENPHAPEEEELAELMEASGYQKVNLDGNVVTLEAGCTLDLGAAGKGIGCDAVAAEMKKHPEVTGLLLNLGGSSIMAYGEKPDQSLWKVAVTDPRGEEDGEYLGVVSLGADEFLSTSGDYEKYFIQDGVRYHHILDPMTGYPARSGLTSVTVVCENGLYADGLSTACFVLGREKAKELLEKYHAEALLVDEDGHVFVTEGMRERFELLQERYSVSGI